MSEGGTRAERLAAVDAELDKELDNWRAMQVNPGQYWRMGNAEFNIRCEILALMEILKDKLGLEQEDFDLVFKRVCLEELRKMRPEVQKQRREAIRNSIVPNGPFPPLNQN